MRKLFVLPLPVKKSLRKLGRDLYDARRRRRIPTTLMAERANISRTTLNKVERGEPTVALGIYACVLYILGMEERLSDLADVTTDKTGLVLDAEHLPQRIHSPKKKAKTSSEAKSKRVQKPNE